MHLPMPPACVKIKTGSPLERAESGLDRPDPKPDLDNANVGKSSADRRRFQIGSVFFV